MQLFFGMCVCDKNRRSMCREPGLTEGAEGNRRAARGRKGSIANFLSDRESRLYLSCICDMKAEKLGYYDGT